MPDLNQRCKRAFTAAAAQHNKLDSVLITDRHDVMYLTSLREGIWGLILTETHAIAITSLMFVDEVKERAPHCEPVLLTKIPKERPDPMEFIAQELKRRELRAVVVDPAGMSGKTYRMLTEQAVSLGLEFLPCNDVMDPIRARKDDDEIVLIERCVQIAEQAFSEFIAQGAGQVIGKTERQIAWELEVKMRDLGADRQGFPLTGIIVATGSHSAGAHPIPGDRKIAEGDIVLIDWGAELHEYRSDSTRVIFPGSVPDFARKAYPVVEESLKCGADALKHGASMADVDRVCRQTVIDAGYPEFSYGVGHGVGLEIHEAPWLRASSKETLATNMLTTIEPGIYQLGVGGIRLENIYRVTEEGCERLGTLPTNLGAFVLP